MVKQSIDLVERGRAKFAYDAVEDIMGKYKNSEKEVVSYIKRLPVMIQANGLGQALAFYYSKKDVHLVIYNKIATWFSPEGNHSIITINGDCELIYEISKMDRSTYRVITTEVMELLNWMRRFADGYVKKSGDEQKSGEQE